MKVLKVLEYIMTGILVLVILAVLGFFYIPKLFGSQPYAVISGSMVASNVSESDKQFYKEEYGIEELHGYEVGCITYVRKVNFSEIQKGDAITFSIGNNTVVTHMVVDIDEENQAFTTHGIANAINVNENNIAYTNVIGKASDFSIPLAGYILNWASSTSAKILLITYIAIFGIVIVANNLLEKMDDKKEEETEKSEE